MGPEYRDSLDLVRAYRAVHAYPLKSVTMGLRHHARKAAGGSWLDISQRLKQLPTITDKLVRMPKTNLARIQDIGGCRATFLDQATVDTAISSIENRAVRGPSWDIVDIDDYVDERTRPDGYRAKHVIVRKHGVQVEMQFRTSAQHNWPSLLRASTSLSDLASSRAAPKRGPLNLSLQPLRICDDTKSARSIGRDSSKL